MMHPPSRHVLGSLPVGAARVTPGYGMNPPPVPAGLPPHLAAAVPGQFTHTLSYKDFLARSGLEFHTEIFDLVIDPVAQSGAAIAAGATVVATARITQEADFVSEKWVFSVTPIGATFTVRIVDNATQRNLSNAAIQAANAGGTAQRPRILKPRLWRRNSDVSITFVNTSGGNITALQWVMSGYKLFDSNALNLNNPQ